MFDLAAQNLIALGMKKLGKAVAEVTLDGSQTNIYYFSLQNAFIKKILDILVEKINHC